MVQYHKEKYNRNSRQSYKNKVYKNQLKKQVYKNTTMDGHWLEWPGRDAKPYKKW